MARRRFGTCVAFAAGVLGSAFILGRLFSRPKVQRYGMVIGVYLVGMIFLYIIFARPNLRRYTSGPAFQPVSEIDLDRVKRLFFDQSFFGKGRMPAISPMMLTNWASPGTTILVLFASAFSTVSSFLRSCAFPTKY